MLTDCKLMSLSHIPKDLFRVLVSKNASFYVAAIAALHDELVQNASEVDHTPKQVRSIIHMCLLQRDQNIRWEEAELALTEDVAGKEPNETIMLPSVEIENRIYRDLVKSGWLKEMEGKGYRIIVFMPQLSAALFDALHAVATTGPEAIGAKCQFIYNALKNACESPVEHSLTLVEAADQAKSYCRRLGSVVGQVREITAQILDEYEPKEVFRLFFDELSERIMLADYKNIGGPDHPYRFRDKVLLLNSQIETNKKLREGFVQGLIKQRGYERGQAEEELSSITLTIHGSFEKMDLLVRRIQSHASNITERAKETARYILFCDPGNSEIVKRLIQSIDASKQENFQLPCARLRALDPHGLYKPPIPKAKAEAVKSESKPVPASEIARQRALRDRLAKRKIYPDRVENYIEAVLRGKDSVTTDQCPVNTLDELLALVHLRDMVEISEHTNHVLKKLKDKYIVEKIGEAISETEIMTAPTLLIKRVQ